jgi:protein-S-isoprenylcysteine O-methyltransferase Ste14
MLARALLAILVLPGVVAGLIPAVILGGHLRAPPGALPGEILMAAGILLLLWCARDFFASGRGSIAPWDPPKRLVVVGLYRFVRNPMYLSVLVLVAGWAVAFASWPIGLYLGILALGFHLRVRLGEEPWLRLRFGAEWDAYGAAVPRWRPRRRPWRASPPPGRGGNEPK